MNPIILSGSGEVETRRTGALAEAERGTETKDGAGVSNAGGNSGVAKPADSVNLSERAAAIAELTTKVDQLPDVRAERVEQLRALVEAGNYNPSAEDIADAIIKDSSQ